MSNSPFQDKPQDQITTQLMDKSNDIDNDKDIANPVDSREQSDYMIPQQHDIINYEDENKCQDPQKQEANKQNDCCGRFLTEFCFQMCMVLLCPCLYMR